jgi:isopropylmalate/homocitrate/citramalate synthase
VRVDQHEQERTGKKLNRLQIEERDTLMTAVRDAISAYNGELTNLIELVRRTRDDKIEPARMKIAEAVAAWYTWRFDIADTMEAYASERSEAWQESEAAQAYADWKELYETAEVTLPDELDVDSLFGVDDTPDPFDDYALPDSPEEA